MELDVRVPEHMLIASPRLSTRLRRSPRSTPCEAHSNFYEGCFSLNIVGPRII